MRNENIERDIKNAVQRLTPDVFDSVLEKCGAPQAGTYIIRQRKPGLGTARAWGALAAAVVLVFGGLFGYNALIEVRVDAVVMLEANPSVELTVNAKDRVIDVATRNDDAVKILDGMDLSDTQLNVAVNALIGSMLKYGYIREDSNSVLISVGGGDDEKNAAIQRALTESVGMQLSAVDGAVISQTVSGDGGLQKLAEESKISYGKAALVQRIINESSHLAFSELAALSVNELNLLADAKDIEADGLAYSGEASDKSYIGEERAAQAALDHAGLEENEIGSPEVELNYDNSAMIYEVDFIFGGNDYEYEIDARDGSVIEYDTDEAK